MKLQTKKIICLLVAITSVMTIVSAVSYAYFTAMADVQEQSAVLTSGTMRVKFSDNDTGLSAELNFGESVTKKFTIENTGTLDATIYMYWEDLINTYTKGSLTYTLSQSETEDGTYTEVVSNTNVPISKTASRKNLSSGFTIPAGETYYYNLIITLNYLEDVNQDADINAKFSTKFNIGNEELQLPITERIIAASNGVRTSFDDPAISDEGIFEMEDDYGTSYYYRGAVENNYVKFGKNASGQDMYWRIIRVNGDGSLRILYTGTQAYANGTNNSDMFIGTSAFNTNYTDNKYVGYMYGPAGTDSSTSKVQAQTNTESSTIKTYIDNWYKTNIVDTGYSNAVADIIFCNDRNTPGKTSTGYSSDTGLGYGTNYTAFGAYARTGVQSVNYTNVNPTFKCSQKNDAFTVSNTTKGNGALTYPVGLITADEIVAAGSGQYATANSSYYLYRPNNYWLSLSPCYFTGSYSSVFSVCTSGQLCNSTVSSAGGVAPVINLSAEYVENMVGEGTMENLYRVM